MKKIVIVLSVLFILSITNLINAAEDNTIQSVVNNGRVIVMLDGSAYLIFSYDTVTSGLWLPGTDVVITYDKIINVDDDESVDYERQIR